jgi:two-component system, OmpR family, sensor kinase
VKGLQPLGTLRVQLSLIAVLLVAGAVAGVGVATHYQLQKFMLNRVDRQFESAQKPVLAFLAGRSDGTPSPAQQQLLGALSPDSYAAVISGENDVAAEQYFGGGAIPAQLRVIALRAPMGKSSAGGYRVAVISAAQTQEGFGPALKSGNRLVIAIPLSDVNSTVHRLDSLALIAGLAVVAGVAVLAYLLVRRTLRPLARIEDTAAAIAGGDFSRRVPDEHPASEVGSLAVSLNSMLAQIERAFDERRRSEQRLRRFVADASHELKTPLTSVRGFAELFRRGAAERPTDLALAMSRIESEAQRMDVLVDDLLLLANLDQGRPVAREPFDLGAVVAEMVHDHALLHEDWPINLEPEGACHLVGDELRVRQAIGNLLTNARAHTPPGTTIRVRLLAGAGECRIEVEDDGPGIPLKQQPHVFERFFRADPSRARASGGSGLGLSITQAIVEAHGGHVSLVSTPGAGTTFRISLPTDGAPATPRQPEAERRTV